MNKLVFDTPKLSKLISKLSKSYLRYVKPMSLFWSVCRIKLITFTHQFAFNFPESDVKLENELESRCEIVKPK